ncbi:MAG: YqaE/Pmp3 family membrane protein [Chitinophagaceae bacterium]|nr:YqaE/Pmp3 family membrane protein [Chitinophagaceae bacterium]
MKKQLLLCSFLFVLLFQSTAVNALIVPVKQSAVPEKVMTESVDEFKQLSKKEKKQRIKEVKKQLKLFKANKAAGKADDEELILLVVLAILLPPLAVYLHQNAINTKFWISLVLTLLFFLPGVIYSLLVVLGVV